MKKILFSFVLLLNVLGGIGQTPSFIKTHGLDMSFENGFNMISCPDSGFIITGKSQSSLFLAKIDKFGNKVWQKDNSNFQAFGNAEGASLLRLDDGNYVVQGQRWSNHFILKFAENGDTIFSKTLQMPGLITAYSETPGHTRVIKTSDGGYAAVNVARTLDQTPKKRYTLLVKYDANFDTLWTTKFNGNTTVSMGYDLTQGADGAFYIAGWIDSEGQSCRWIMNAAKCDENGNLLWNRKYAKGEGFSIHPLANGNFLFAGYSYDKFPGPSYKWIYKLDSNGDTISVHRGGESAINRFIPTADGGAFGFPGTKFDANGDVEWENEGELEGYSIYSGCEMLGGGFAFIGTLECGDPKYDEVVIITTDSRGMTNGILKLDNENLNLYPNPSVSGKVKVSGLKGSYEKFTVDVYNNLGQKMGTEGFQQNMELNLSAYPTGIYNLVISSGFDTQVRRVEIK